MRHVVLLLFAVSAVKSSQIFPYEPAVPEYGLDNNATLLEELELRKRDGNCPKDYTSCGYANAPGFCCKNNAVCTIDIVGHAVCCPNGAACTGTVGGTGFATGGGSGGGGVVVATGAAGTSTTTTSFGLASTTNPNGGIVIISGGGSGLTTTNAGSAATVAVLPNALYPFKVIPTTYINAAACSAAWSGCQTDMARCTSYLGGGQGNNGVTISAPNYVSLQATTTFAMPTASSICSGYSMQACSGLQVSACAVYGTANGAAMGMAGCGYYGAGMGAAAVGFAGQMLLR
jgi:hypothetical protein